MSHQFSLELGDFLRLRRDRAPVFVQAHERVPSFRLGRRRRRRRRRRVHHRAQRHDDSIISIVVLLLEFVSRRPALRSLAWSRRVLSSREIFSEASAFGPSKIPMSTRGECDNKRYELRNPYLFLSPAVKRLPVVLTRKGERREKERRVCFRLLLFWSKA